MLFLLQDLQQPLRALWQRFFEIGPALNADTQHDDRHIQFGKDQCLRISREAFSQKVGAGKDADIELFVNVIETGSVVNSVVKMPERNVSGIRGQGAQRSLADQIIAGIADILEFAEIRFLAFGLRLLFRVEDVSAVRPSARDA